MLTIKPVGKAKDAQHYYNNKDNYYLTDKESLKDASLWLGKGAEALSLSGTVEPNRFLSLLNGELPNGEVLGIVKNGIREHRAGTDVTLSAPKSVSILALIGRDERIVNAHQKAVMMTFERIEAMAAEARITFNKETSFEKTNNLTAASFLHTSSRELDPDLHTHLVIMNITKRLDEQWRALASRAKDDKENLDHGFREIIYQNQHYFGLIYMSTLAKEIKALGYDIRIQDMYGNFEIEGVSDELIKDFSKRREDILNDLQEKGYYSAKAAEVSNGATRKKKEDIDSQTLLMKWLDEIKNKDVNLDAIIASSKERESQDLGGRTTPKIIEKISENAKEAVADAIAHLSEFNTAIKHATLVRQAFVFAAGSINHDEIEQEITALQQSGMLAGKEHEYYTTDRLIKKENAFVEEMLKNPKEIFSVDSTGQGAAASILSKNNRVQLVDVNGFSNQKDLLQSFVDIAEKNELNVYVLHQGRNQAQMLSNDLKRTSNSFFSWLRSLFKDEIVHTVAGFKYQYGKNINPHNKENLIIVHDAQKLSLDDLLFLNQISQKSRGRMILLNNTESTLGYSPGNPMKTLKDNGIESIQCLSARKHIQANLRLSAQPTQALVDTWLTYDKEMRHKTSIVALSNQQASELNHHIRTALVQQGEIDNMPDLVKVLSTESLTEAQKAQGKFYNPGDRLSFNAFTKEQKHYTVKAIEKDVLILENEAGIQSKFNLKDKSAFVVSKSKTLALAKGDWITNDRPLISGRQRIDKGASFYVSHIDEKAIHLENEGKRMTMSLDDFAKSYFSYGYCKKMGALTGREDHILLSAKPHQLNKNLCGELSDKGKNITLFTNNLSKAQKFLDSEQIKWTANDILKKTPDTLYRDIAQADKLIAKDIKYLLDTIEINGSSDKKAIAERAVSYALARCGEREAAFRHTDLITHALNHAFGKASFEDIAPILKARIIKANLIHLDTCWTTPQALALEEGIIHANFSEQARVAPIINDANHLNLPDYLTKGQREAIMLAATTNDRFVTIQGLAGVGKTTMMQQIQTIAQSQGFKVIGLAPTHQAKSELASRGIEAATIDSFLTNETPIDEKTLLIIDEASMIDNVKYHALQKTMIAANARGIFTGDITQLQSLASGIPHELTVKTGSQKIVFMDEIMRQNPNPELKKAAEFASNREIAKAFEILSKIDPEPYLERTTSFEQKKHSSVIEIDCKPDEQGKKNYHPVYEAITNDYLSRSQACQQETIIVVHAHEDRAIIDNQIRAGLKQQKQISNEGQSINRLFSKSMAKAELLLVENFKPGDVLRFGTSYRAVQRNEYLTIDKVNKETNELYCKTADGISLNIKPDTLIHGKAALYSHGEFELSPGDRIRLKHSNEDKGFVANKQYTVTDVKNGIVSLKNGHEHLQLNTNDPSDQHWDYAYTNTAYSSQGATTKFEIALELENRVVVTTHRSHEIDITRASHQVSIYTDNAEGLITRLEDRLQQRKADKLSALIEKQHYLDEKTQSKAIGQALKSTQHTKEAREASSKVQENPIQPTSKIGENYKQRTAQIDATEILNSLNAQAERLAKHLLGEPNSKLSNSKALRYGAKGSLKVSLDKGLWHNFETGESGNMLQLIQNELQLGHFKETLDYAAKFVNHIPIQDLLKVKPKATPSIKSQEDSHEGMRALAKELYEKSQPIKGSIVEKYLLVHRGCRQVDGADLRYCPSIKSKRDGKTCYSPALLAFAKDKDGKINHVQVTRINAQTANKDKSLTPTKQTYGAMNGFAVNLNRKGEGEITYLTEGVETGLSIIEANPKARVYATLGKQNFATINTDYLSKSVVLCLDNDGENTFKYQKGSESNTLIDATTRLEEKGFQVFVSMSKTKGRDLNDALIQEGVKGVEREIQNLLSVDEFKKLCARANKEMDKPTHSKAPVPIKDAINRTGFINLNNPNMPLANKSLINSIRQQSLNASVLAQKPSAEMKMPYKNMEREREI